MHYNFMPRKPSLGVVLGVGIAYVGLVWVLRRKRDADLRKEKSVHQISRNVSSVELREESLTAMELNGLLRVYAIPSISLLLRSTGGFNTDCPRRYQDMEFLIREWCENNVFEEERATTAIKRVNCIHSQHHISNDDMLYVLSVFFLTVPRWADKYGWRSFHQFEKDASYEYWHRVGTLMGIDNLWDSYEAADRWNLEYEQRKLRYAPSNATVAIGTVEYYIRDLPKFVQQIVMRVFAALIEPDLREALGLPPPPFGIRPMILAGRFVRKNFVRYLLPPRPLSWQLRFTPPKAKEPASEDGKIRYVPVEVTHGNQLYKKNNQGYVIEDMGPTDCPKGQLRDSYKRAKSG